MDRRFYAVRRRGRFDVLDGGLDEDARTDAVVITGLTRDQLRKLTTEHCLRVVGAASAHARMAGLRAIRSL